MNQLILTPEKCILSIYSASEKRDIMFFKMNNLIYITFAGLMNIR